MTQYFPLISGFIVLGSALAYVLMPFLKGFPSSLVYDDIKSYRRLSFEKNMILGNLRDLEMDLGLKKITFKDYEQLKARMLSEAEGVYLSLDTLTQKSPFFELLEKDLAMRQKELQ